MLLVYILITIKSAVFDIYIMSMKTVTDGCTLMDLLYVCQETRFFELKKKKKERKRRKKKEKSHADQRR